MFKIKKSLIVINNSEFSNNKNIKRNSCGNIYISGNLKLSISNSKFTKNEVKGNGGAMYIDFKYITLNLKMIFLNFHISKTYNNIYI